VKVAVAIIYCGGKEAVAYKTDDGTVCGCCGRPVAVVDMRPPNGRRS
jgi:hypothetical protein